MGYDKDYCWRKYRHYCGEVDRWQACLYDGWGTDLGDVEGAVKKEYNISSINFKMVKLQGKLQDAMSGFSQFEENPAAMARNNMLKEWSGDSRLSSAMSSVNAEIGRVKRELNDAKYYKDLWYSRYKNADDEE